MWGKSVYLPARQCAHTRTHTGLQTKQSPRRKYISFCLVQKGLANNGENWDGKIPRCSLKCWFVCLEKKKTNREMWVALDPGGLRWIDSHIQWMSFTFLISSSHIYFLFTPDLHMNNTEDKILLARQRLLWWSSDWESTCQGTGHRINPWSRKIPHAGGQLSLWATATEVRVPRAWPRQEEKPGQQAVCWPELKKTRVQKRRPSTAISK